MLAYHVLFHVSRLDLKCKLIWSSLFNWLIDWLIDWGLTPFLTISQLYHGGQFTYSCISWFSHTSTPHNNLPKQLAAFSHRLSPLAEGEWRMSHWLLSILGKKVGRAGIRTHNPWIDSLESLPTELLYLKWKPYIYY